MKSLDGQVSIPVHNQGMSDNTPDTSQPTLLLVDGSSYLYRAFHAMPDLRAVPGDPSSPATQSPRQFWANPGRPAKGWVRRASEVLRFATSAQRSQPFAGHLGLFALYNPCFPHPSQTPLAL